RAGSQPCGRIAVVRRRAVLRECQMGMTIHESGHHHATCGVDFDSVARAGKILQSAGGSYFLDDSVAHQKGAVVNDREFLLIGAAPNPVRPAQSDQLAGAANEIRTVFLPPYCNISRDNILSFW